MANKTTGPDRTEPGTFGGDRGRGTDSPEDMDRDRGMDRDLDEERNQDVERDKKGDRGPGGRDQGTL
jgi:hypothetical protein